MEAGTYDKGNSGQGKKSLDINSDEILFYTKSDKSVFNPIFQEYTEDYLNKFYKYIEEDGRKYRLISMIGPGGAAKGNPFYEIMGVKRFWRYSEKKMQELINKKMVVQTNTGAVPQRKQYLDEGKGVSIQSIWDDIYALSASSQERLGYPTQKPEALLERIIRMSSNEGDVVADFFCGCGTTISVAQKLNRKWLGADISHLAIRLIVKRLADSYGESVKNNIKIHGFPADVASARELAEKTDKGRILFQDWVIEVLLTGVVNEKKVADGGFDGYLTYNTEEGKEFVLIEVKSGKVNVTNIREFIRVIDKQKANAGIFVCFESTLTKEMTKEAKSAGCIQIGAVEFGQDKIQILTIEQLMSNHHPNLPNVSSTFKKAQRKEGKGGKLELF